MKLLDEYQISRAYWQCVNGNDIEEIRSLITHSEWAYWYCSNVKDREEIWSKINDEAWAFSYCLHIKDRPEVRMYITGKISLRNLNEMIMERILKKGEENCGIR